VSGAAAKLGMPRSTLESKIRAFEEGLGESDFRVLEVLLHKGPMPVNAIGPKVYLNPGSVSVGVVVGWPLLMGMIIVASNASGIFTGEWNGVSAQGKSFLTVGLAVILTALGVLALAQRYS
jgi:hypothetical protein